jgi:hypothetical protein
MADHWIRLGCERRDGLADQNTVEHVADRGDNVCQVDKKILTVCPSERVFRLHSDPVAIQKNGDCNWERIGMRLPQAVLT